MNGTSATQLLIEATQGDRNALDSMLPLVYDELHRLAMQMMRGERPAHTYRPTDLVNEAYLRLIDQQQVDWRNRAQFLGIAAQMMRRVLVNYARERNAAKRGVCWRVEDTLSLLDGVPGTTNDIDVLALNEALQRLDDIDSRKRQVVELKFFGGLTITEIASVLSVSEGTIERDWTFARAYLLDQLSSGA